MRSVEAISDKNVKWEEGRMEGWKDGFGGAEGRAPSRLGEIKIGDGTDVSAEALAKAEAIPR